MEENEIVVDKEILDSFTSLYVMKKLEDSSWDLKDEEHHYSSYKCFRTIMLSNDFENHLMIVYSLNDVQFLICVSRDADYEIMKIIDEYGRKYSADCEISNNKDYYFTFRFENHNEFEFFFKENILPFMGFKESEYVFSWI